MSTPETGRALGTSDLGHPAILLVTVGGVGLLRPAPGTWGSILTALLVWPLIVWLPVEVLTPVLIGLAALALLVGLVLVPSACRRSGRKDPSAVVIDEAAGMCCALAVLPAHLLRSDTLAALLTCLLCFRFFDAVKPGPVGWLEALPGSPGVMLDDILAGVMAGACAFAFLH